MPLAAPAHDKLADPACRLEELVAVLLRRAQQEQLLVNVTDALMKRELIHLWLGRRRWKPAAAQWGLHGVAGAWRDSGSPCFFK